MAVGQNPVPLVNINIGGKWMFIHPKMEPQGMPHGHVWLTFSDEGLEGDLVQALERVNS